VWWAAFREVCRADRWGRRDWQRFELNAGRGTENCHPDSRARSSGVSSGLLIRKVSPNYPPLARQARIQGTVILQAQISKDGSIQNLQLISGHPMLAPAAIEAVKQWKYKPYLLNGEPVEVETQVQVNFTLAGG